MLGKHIEAEVAGPDGEPLYVSGIVTGVRFSSDGVAMLELDSGQAVRALDVVRVTPLDAAQRAPVEDTAKQDTAKTRAGRGPLSALAQPVLRLIA
jgi:hypothetical protein